MFLSSYFSTFSNISFNPCPQKQNKIEKIVELNDAGGGAVVCIYPIEISRTMRWISSTMTKLWPSCLDRNDKIMHFDSICFSILFHSLAIDGHSEKRKNKRE